MFISFILNVSFRNVKLKYQLIFSTVGSMKVLLFFSSFDT